MTYPIERDEGPAYPALGPHVATLRRKSAGNPALRREYQEAILAAVRALQVRELQRELPEQPCNSASRTKHQTGAKILAAVKGQNDRAFWAAVERDRRSRTDQAIVAEYEFVMRPKRLAAIAANLEAVETAWAKRSDGLPVEIYGPDQAWEYAA